MGPLHKRLGMLVLRHVWQQQYSVKTSMYNRNWRVLFLEEGVFKECELKDNLVVQAVVKQSASQSFIELWLTVLITNWFPSSILCSLPISSREVSPLYPNRSILYTINTRLMELLSFQCNEDLRCSICYFPLKQNKFSAFLRLENLMLRCTISITWETWWFDYCWKRIWNIVLFVFVWFCI